jgi:antitoxin StbD
MLHQILARAGVSISDLKKNPSAVIAAADGYPIAILNRNTPAAYIVPADAWEAIMDRLEDIELAEIVRQREGEEAVSVDIEDLLNLDDI